jgi:hypothetical protein
MSYLILIIKSCDFFIIAIMALYQSGPGTEIYEHEQKFSNRNRNLVTGTEIYEQEQKFSNRNRNLGTGTEIYEQEQKFSNRNRNL